MSSKASNLKESKVSNSDIEKIDSLLNDLYELRHTSINKDKEKGVGNQVYKEFRSRGYIKNLKTLRTQLKDRELSMENLTPKSGSIKENRQPHIVKQSLKEHFTKVPSSSRYQDIQARPRYYELKEGLTYEIKELSLSNFLRGINAKEKRNAVSLTESKAQEKFYLPVIDRTTNTKEGTDYVYSLYKKYGKNTKCPVMIVRSIHETYDTSGADKLTDIELASQVQWKVVDYIQEPNFIDCCMKDESGLINISDSLWVGVFMNESGKIENDNDGDSETYDYLKKHKLGKTLRKAYKVANQWCKEQGLLGSQESKEPETPIKESLSHIAKNKNGRYLFEHNGNYKISRLPEGVDIELDSSRFKQTGISYDLDMGNEYSEPLADLVFYGRYYLNQDDLRKIKKDDSFELPENKQNNYYLVWAEKERVWLYDLVDEIAGELKDEGVDLGDYNGGVSVVSSQKLADKHNHKELDDYIYVTKQDIINYVGWWTIDDFETWSDFREFCIKSFE